MQEAERRKQAASFDIFPLMCNIWELSIFQNDIDDNK